MLYNILNEIRALWEASLCGIAAHAVLELLRMLSIFFVTHVGSETCEGFVERLRLKSVQRETMAGRKSKLDEWLVLEIEESEGAAVHGVVTELSPVKVSKNCRVRYFDRKMSDGEKSVHVVSFDPALRISLEQSRMERSGVAVINCQVKAGRGGGDKEIVATNRKKVEDSP